MSQGPRPVLLAVAVPLLAAALSGCISQSLDPQGLLGPGATVPGVGAVLQFLPEVPVDSERRGGEPSIVVDHNNHYYMSAPSGMVATTFNSIVDPTSALAQGPHNRQSFIWKSEDLGATWRILTNVPLPAPAPPLRSDATFGGADTDLAVDDCNTIYYTDLWLGNIAVSHSDDGGATWTGTPYTGVLPVLDRQWLAAGNECGEVFLLYQTFYAQVWVLRSTDKGMTFPEQTLVLDCADKVGTGVEQPVTAGAVEGCYNFDGNIAWDRATDSLYFVTGAADSRGLYIFKSGDDGATWSKAEVALPGPVSLIPAIATDAAGNVYAVAAVAPNDEASDAPPASFNIYMTRSVDQGETYSEAWSVSGPVDEGTEVFPWVAAGDAGKVAVVWYGSEETAATTDDVQGDWFVYAAASLDAAADMPVWTIAKASETPMHQGDICSLGLGCTLPQPVGTRGNRNLADFFENAIDMEGRLVIAYASDLDTAADFTSRPYFVRQGDGPRFGEPMAPDGA